MRNITKEQRHFLLLLLLLVVQIVIFTGLFPSFLSLYSIENILLSVSVLGIASIGLGLLMISGGIDISMGSNMGFSATLVALLIEQGQVPTWLAIMIMLLIAAIIGIVHGILVTKVHLDPMIVTIGTQSIMYGSALVLNGGMSIGVTDPAFRFLGWGRIAGIPAQIAIFLILLIIAYVILAKTPLGRKIYVLGDNAEAGKISGIKVDRIRIGLYCMTSILASFGGIIIASQYSAGHPSIGSALLFPIVTAVILGGVAFTGGSGSLQGILLGVLILGVLENGMNLIGVDDFVQNVVQGLILLAVMLSNESWRFKYIIRRIQYEE